jgi:hypothetical protein
MLAKYDTKRKAESKLHAVLYSVFECLMLYSDKVNIVTDWRHSIAHVGYIAEFLISLPYPFSGHKFSVPSIYIITSFSSTHEWL